MKSSSHSECPLSATHSPFFGRRESTPDETVTIRPFSNDTVEPGGQTIDTNYSRTSESVGDERLGIQKLADTEVYVQRVDKTRRDLLRGDVSLDEVGTGLEEADLTPLTTDEDVDSERLREAYLYAEYAVAAGTTKTVVDTLTTEFGLSTGLAFGITIAVGGSIKVSKDKLNRSDIYLVREVCRALGVEERAKAFFETIGSDAFETDEEPEQAQSQRGNR
ncbi:hypothetical protein RYH80_10455 [Halobaculum sp. MBLA0147]|uniref:hypothetical protein n=1 Tax=Halobaculum sp. MBLA0147 TaxID=3079934 RepID=UPI003525FDF6